MAVTSLPQRRVTSAIATDDVAIPSALLLLTLVAPALDVLAMAQQRAALPTGLVAGVCWAAGVLLGLACLRRGWTAALVLAVTALLASATLRMTGAEALGVVGSLVSIVALGSAGFFASHTSEDLVGSEPTEVSEAPPPRPTPRPAPATVPVGRAA